jgi:cell division protein FtsB
MKSTLNSMSERRLALIAEFQRWEAARTEAAARDAEKPRMSSRQRQIQSLKRENQELRSEIDELKRFLIELGEML